MNAKIIKGSELKKDREFTLSLSCPYLNPSLRVGEVPLSSTASKKITNTI